MCDKVFILDPGHGGIDPASNQYVTPGKRSPIWPDGSVYYEGVGNRNIAQLAGNILKAKGAKVFYTVEPNNWKDVSLTARCTTANQIFKAYPNAILCSIHSNAASDPKAHGYEAFTSPGQTKSDPVATNWLEEQAKKFPNLRKRTDLSDGDPDKEAKFTILTETTGRAILIEMMFHTNPTECKIIQSTNGVRDCAAAIADALWRS